MTGLRDRGLSRHRYLRRGPIPPPDIAIDGQRLADLAIPDVVTPIDRHNEVNVPRGDTEIRADDVLLITTNATATPSHTSPPGHAANGQR